MSRTIVIGDIHGCYDELADLVNKFTLASDDRVVAVGDLTVKGPKSRLVLNLFSTDSRFYSVIGNHDRDLVRHWEDCETPLTAAQEKAFKELQTSDDRYLGYLASLPLFINLGSHVIIHAGLRPGVALDAQVADDLVELRTLGPDRTSREGTPWYELYEGPALALFGHWPAAKPRMSEHAIGLDTGCVYGRQLTSYVIETGEFVSVFAAQPYDNSGAKS